MAQTCVDAWALARLVPALLLLGGALLGGLLNPLLMAHHVVIEFALVFLPAAAYGGLFSALARATRSDAMRWYGIDFLGGGFLLFCGFVPFIYWGASAAFSPAMGNSVLEWVPIVVAISTALFYRSLAIQNVRRTTGMP